MQFCGIGYKHLARAASPGEPKLHGIPSTFCRQFRYDLERTHLLQQLQGTVQVVQIAQIDVRRFDLLQRHQ